MATGPRALRPRACVTSPGESKGLRAGYPCSGRSHRGAAAIRSSRPTSRAWFRIRAAISSRASRRCPMKDHGWDEHLTSSLLADAVPARVDHVLELYMSCHQPRRSLGTARKLCAGALYLACAAAPPWTTPASRACAASSARQARRPPSSAAVSNPRRCSSWAARPLVTSAGQVQ